MTSQRKMSYHMSTICALCSLMLLLISCGTTWSGSSGPEKHLLIVTRTTAVSHNHFPSFNKQIDDLASVTHLYNVIQSLPPMHKGYACPADNGLQYQLAFSLPSVSEQQWTLAGSGCRQIRLNQSHSFLTTDEFWSLFAQTLGISESDLFPPPRSS